MIAGTCCAACYKNCILFFIISLFHLSFKNGLHLLLENFASYRRISKIALMPYWIVLLCRECILFPFVFLKTVDNITLLVLSWNVFHLFYYHSFVLGKKSSPQFWSGHRSLSHTYFDRSHRIDIAEVQNDFKVKSFRRSLLAKLPPISRGRDYACTTDFFFYFCALTSHWTEFFG